MSASSTATPGAEGGGQGRGESEPIATLPETAEIGAGGTNVHSPLYLKQVEKLRALPELPEYTKPPAPRKDSTWNAWGGGRAQQTLRKIALIPQASRSVEEKRELVDAAIVEWESFSYVERHLRGVSKLAKKYKYPKSSLRKFLSHEQSSDTIGQRGRSQAVDNAMYRGLVQAADEKAKSGTGLSGEQVRFSSHLPRFCAHTHCCRPCSPALCTPALQFDAVLGHAADALGQRSARQDEPLAAATRTKYARQEANTDLKIGTVREVPKEGGKIKAMAPEVVAAMFINIKGEFEKYNWPGAPLGSPMIPSVNCWFHDEVALTCDDDKRGYKVVIAGANGKHALGKEFTSGGNHVTLMASQTGSGQALPGFLIFTGKQWTTKTGRLRGVPSNWTATYSETGSNLKNKNGDELEVIAQRIIDGDIAAAAAAVQSKVSAAEPAPRPSTTRARTRSAAGSASDADAKRKCAARNVAHTQAEKQKDAAAAMASPQTSDTLRRRIEQLQRKRDDNQTFALAALRAGKHKLGEVFAQDAMDECILIEKLRAESARLDSPLDDEAYAKAVCAKAKADQEKSTNRGTMHMFARHLVKCRGEFNVEGHIINVMDDHGSVRSLLPTPD